MHECVRKLYPISIPHFFSIFSLDCIFENSGSCYSEEVDETAKVGAPVQCIKSACCTGRRTEMPILLLLPIGGWSLENKLEVLNKSYHERNTRIRRSRGSAVPQDFPLDDLEIGN